MPTVVNRGAEAFYLLFSFFWHIAVLSGTMGFSGRLLITDLFPTTLLTRVHTAVHSLSLGHLLGGTCARWDKS